jgi:anti-sigma regulatory factor (Ser/Thr protein kinase)
MELPPFTAAYPSTAASLKLARDAVCQHLREHTEMSSARLLDLEIALGELLQNIIRHSFGGGDLAGSFLIDVTLEEGMIKVQVTDSAPELDSTDFLHKSYIASEEGGMGLSLIRQLTSKYVINRLNNKNINSLYFNY